MPGIIAKSLTSSIDSIVSIEVDYKKCNLIIKYKDNSKDIINYKGDESLLYYDFNYIKYKLENKVKGDKQIGR